MRIVSCIIFKSQVLKYLLKRCHYCSGDDIHNKTGILGINLIRWRFRVVIVSLEKQQIIHILSVCL